MAETHTTENGEKIDPKKHPYPIMRIALKMPNIISRIAREELFKLHEDIDRIVALNDALAHNQALVLEDVRKSYGKIANDLSHYCGRLKSRLNIIFGNEDRFSEEWKWVVTFFEYIATLIHQETSEKTKSCRDAIMYRIQWIQHPEKHDEMLEELRRSKGVEI